jgi:hypothetical protein
VCKKEAVIAEEQRSREEMPFSKWGVLAEHA